MTVRIVVLLSALTLVACDKAPAPEPGTDGKAQASEAQASETQADPHAAFTNLSPDQVASMLEDASCVAVDANSAKTREKYGMLPNAVQLAEGFDPKALPDDKKTKLVFYCGSQRCSAAPKAAKLAFDAGYSDVNVMRAGIKGWVKAGKKVDKPTS